MKSLRIATASLALFAGLFVGCSTAPVKPDPVVTAPVEAPKPKEMDATELFAEAVKAFDAGKLDDAEKSFARVVEKAPDNVSARYNLGVIAERKGDIAGAQAQYEAAHKLDANHEPTLLNLGKIYRLQAKVDKAIALYEAALAAPGKEYDVQLLNNLAVSYRLSKQYDKAEASLRKLLSRTKDNADAYKNLALVYYDQGKYSLAEFISGNARKLDEKDPGVYNNLGMIYLATNQKPLALAQFRKAVELNPEFAPGHMNIGAMALTYRDYETAEQSLRKALQLDPNSPEARLYLAYALDGQKGRDSKKGVEAGGEFEKYLTVRTDDGQAVCGAGWAYSVDKAGWEKAVSFLEKCKSWSGNTPTDIQLIDAKLKGLASMIKAGQAQPAPGQKREAPKVGAKGTSLLDKVSADAAAQEAANPQPEGAAPAAPGAPAEGGQKEQGSAPAPH